MRAICFLLAISIFTISCDSNYDHETESSGNNVLYTQLSESGKYVISPEYADNPIVILMTELLNIEDYREAISMIIEGVIKVNVDNPVVTNDYVSKLRQLENIFLSMQYEQFYTKEEIKTAIFYSIRELATNTMKVSYRGILETVPQVSSPLDYGIFAYGRDRDCSQFDDSDLGVECCKKITCDAADCMEDAQDIFIEALEDDFASWAVSTVIAIVVWVVNGAIGLVSFGATSAAGTAVAVLITNTMRKLFGLQGTPVIDFAQAICIMAHI